MDEKFPDPQFVIDKQQFTSLKKDKSSKGVGNIIFVKQNLVVKKITKFSIFDTRKHLCGATNIK